jgi:hypothetical protein
LSRIYGYCVGEIGIDPLYFLDEMSQDEIASIIKIKNGPEAKYKGRKLSDEEIAERVKSHKR